MMLEQILDKQTPSRHRVCVHAPGKLILCGEHAVLYGAPAIACAINRYTKTTVKKSNSLRDIIKLKSLNIKKSVPYTLLKSIEQEFLSKHESYRLGKALIKDVLKEPLDMSIYTAAKLLKISNRPINYGLDIETTSSIPISCGMGSSAANIVSLLCALKLIFNIELNEQNMLEFARQVESLQHGASSGLDIQLSMFGGCIRFEGGQSRFLPIKDTEFTIISTGKPQNTTGECVEHVKPHFQHGDKVEAFSSVSMHIEQALLDGDKALLKKYVHQNHELLVSVGVVPQKTQQMIGELETFDCAAKICGAGAISGDNAGVVWVVGDKEKIALVAQRYGFAVESLRLTATGVVNSLEQ